MMTPEQFRQQLNESQWEAVSYQDGPSLVIAGAGSGKTRVLTYKIAYLIAQGLPPHNILSLTFTNKAAKEMNERIEQLVGRDCTRHLWSGTFHSMFSRILHQESAYLGFSPRFTIYDSDASRSLIKTLVREMELDDKVYRPATVQSRISEAKNLLCLPADYAADAAFQRRDAADGLPRVAEIYARYFARCRQAEVMDFDDILLYTFLLLSHHDDVRRRYMERFRYILVDEYQDTNLAQHRIVGLLTSPESRICVVGDDAQSIYSFRGANIDNILHFTSAYPSARVIKLERNYRSTQTIVDAASSLIARNREQIRKQVYSLGDKGEPIRVFENTSDKDEAAKTAAELRRLHRRGLAWSEAAILYRTNAQSRVFEEAFRAEAIPYRIYGGLSFYQRKEIKDLIAYFRLISNPGDEEAFRRVINYPKRGIGDTTVQRIAAAAREHEVALWDVLCRPAAFGCDVKGAAAAKLQAFRQLIETLAEGLDTQPGSALALDIVERSGIGREITQDKSPENLARVENVNELIAAIKDYERERLEEEGRTLVPLTEYIAQVSLLTDADQKADDEPRVALMTVHAAKGLEFDTVFVVGLEDDLFPAPTARFYPREMEEERRLFYVALTRAKTRLYLSSAQMRWRYGQMEYKSESPFVREIDAKYLLRETPSRTGSGAWPSAERFGPSARFGGLRWADEPRSPSADAAFGRDTSALRPAQRSSTAVPSGFRRVRSASAQSVGASSRASSASVGALSAGDRIEHDRFGRGRVTATEGTGDDAKVVVEFDNAGTKRLLLRFAKFRRL